MPLAPKEMEEAIVRQLKAKTGKTLEEWIAVVKQSGLLRTKEQADHLKSEHGLGHFQAQVIAKRFSSTGASEDEQQLVAQQFKGPNEPLRPLYERLVSEVLRLGGDIHIKPCKTYIPFYRKSQFLIARPKNGVLYLGLPLVSEEFEGKKSDVKGLGMPEKIGLAIPIQSAADLDYAVIGTIALAYGRH